MLRVLAYRGQPPGRTLFRRCGCGDRARCPPREYSDREVMFLRSVTAVLAAAVRRIEADSGPVVVYVKPGRRLADPTTAFIRVDEVGAVNVAVAARMRTAFRSRLLSLADELVEVIASQAVAGHAGEGTGTDLDQLVDRSARLPGSRPVDVHFKDVDRAVSER